MTIKIYYLIPQDIIGFNTLPINGLHDLDGNDFTEDVPLQEENIIQGNISKIKFCIDLITLDLPNEQILSTHFIKVSSFQLAFKITLENRDVDSKKVREFESELRMYLIFSIILANKDIKVYYNNGCKFEMTRDNGLGTFLPYSFIKLTSEGHINTYYQSDYTRCIIMSSRYFSRFENTEIAIIKKLLNKFILSRQRPFKEPTIEMFIHSHTFSWIPKGLFYPAIVILFSCFESLLGKKCRISLFKSDPLLSKFQAIRDAIPHLDGHDIRYNNRDYTVTQYKDQSEKELISPKITILNIDEIEDIRKRLIELILLRI